MTVRIRSTQFCPALISGTRRELCEDYDKNDDIRTLVPGFALITFFLVILFVWVNKSPQGFVVRLHSKFS